jgi:hypothetical protein
MDICNWSHDADGKEMAWTCGYIVDIDVFFGASGMKNT